MFNPWYLFLALHQIVILIMLVLKRDRSLFVDCQIIYRKTLVHNTHCELVALLISMLHMCVHNICVRRTTPSPGLHQSCPRDRMESNRVLNIVLCLCVFRGGCMHVWERQDEWFWLSSLSCRQAWWSMTVCFPAYTGDIYNMTACFSLFHYFISGWVSFCRVVGYIFSMFTFFALHEFM